VQEKVAAKRRRTMVVAVAVATLLGLLAVVLVVRAAGDDEASDEAKSGGALLFLDDHSISGTLAIGAGDVEFGVVNNGSTDHNVGIRGGPITAHLAPGRAGKLQIRDLQPGTYELYCDIADHEERGMTAPLVVVDVAATPTVTSGI
jgi:plastocyanin